MPAPEIRPRGLLNSIGIPSVGLARFLESRLPRLRSLGPPVIVSIAGNSLSEWRELASAIDGCGHADMIELDLSCPNLERGFIWAAERTGYQRNGRDRREGRCLRDLDGQRVSGNGDRYPNVPAGPGKYQRWTNRAGHSVFTTFQKVHVPIIGIGGIATWQDAVEFLLAGASAVAVGTQNFVNPLAMEQVIWGIAAYIEEKGFSSVRDLIGLAHVPHHGQVRR